MPDFYVKMRYSFMPSKRYFIESHYELVMYNMFFLSAYFTAYTESKKSKKFKVLKFFWTR